MIPLTSAPVVRLFRSTTRISAPLFLRRLLGERGTPSGAEVERRQGGGTGASGEESDGFAMPAPGGRRSLLTALAAMLTGLSLMPFTAALAPGIREVVRAVPKSVYASFTQMPSPTCLFVVVSAIWILDVRRRAALVYLAAALALSGLVTEPMKQIFGRARPEAGILMTEDHPSRMVRLVAEYPVLRQIPYEERLDRWLFFTPGRPWFADSFSSFPSGHAMSAFVSAAFLCALYPRGRWLWILVAAGCALARVRARRHFLDDVLFSAGLGWLLASWAFRWHWPARLAHRLGLVQ